MAGGREAHDYVERDMRYGDLLARIASGEKIPSPEVEELRKWVNRVETVASLVSGWSPAGADPWFKSVTIGDAIITGGLYTNYGTAITVRIDADGDVFFGSNIASPGTTSLAIFSNAQTYNGESIGAGDILFGDNTTAKANMLWDASAGQILFRGGTTTQGYIDVTGAAVFGAGAVTLNAGGVAIEQGDAAANSLSWVDYAGTDYYSARLFSTITGSSPSRLGIFNVWAVSEASATISGTMTLETSGKLTIDRYSADTNNAITLLHLRHITTGTPAANFGTSILMSAETDTGNASAQTLLSSVWSDPSNAAPKAEFRIDTVNGTPGNAQYRMRIVPTETVFNEQANDLDFRVESDTDANMIFGDGGTGYVGIGDAAPGEKLDVAGNTNVTGVYKVDDVQVVGPQVVDARCDDAVNSGDATTDGLIDALRDAMIAHGLIAAA